MMRIDKMQGMEKVREEIIQSAIRVFSQDGLKFTMQDIANDMHISKKTIYRMFESKEELLSAMIDYGFGRIYEAKKALMEKDMPPAQKLREVMIAMPDDYMVLDFRELDTLREKYPAVADKLRNYLEGGWEPVYAMIRQGMEDGWIREDLNMQLLSGIFTASLISFLQGDELRKNKIEYQDALHGLMDILTEGIYTR